MEQRWSYRTGPHTPVNDVVLSDREVILTSHGTSGRERRHAIPEAFARPWLVAVHDSKVAFELFSAIAARLSRNEVTGAQDAVRWLFWRAYDPARMAPDTLVYVVANRRGFADMTVSLRLSAHGLTVLAPAWQRDTHHLPDDLFVYGPPTGWMPRHARETLMRRLLGALRPGHGLRVEDGFPRVDHARIRAKQWSLEQRKDGETWLAVEPGCVMAGYTHLQDAGQTTYAPERVLSGDPRVQLGAPPEVQQELMALLSDALQDPPALVGSRPTARDEKPPDAYFELRLRVMDRTPWPCTTMLEFERFLDIPRGGDWGTSTALGLLASLRPGAELPDTPLEVDLWKHGHCYNWHNDRVWLCVDGAGVLLAEECFGGSPGDGVDEVFHVAPDAGARIIFDVGTDHTQNSLIVFVSARDEAALEVLSRHVEAYFCGFGMPAPTRRAPGPGTRRKGDHGA